MLYDVDKIIYIGGGNRPTPNAELLDTSRAHPRWRPAAPMASPRRQHNATILADGTVLVTGGTRGAGFNNLGPGNRSMSPQDAFAQQAAVLKSAAGTKVVVGLAGTCPYGIAACWGGANEALGRLEGVQSVDPIPDTDALFRGSPAISQRQIWAVAVSRPSAVISVGVCSLGWWAARCMTNSPPGRGCRTARRCGR